MAAGLGYTGPCSKVLDHGDLRHRQLRVIFPYRMGYAVIAVIALFALALLGRVINRRLEPASFPASDLLRRLPPNGPAKGHLGEEDSKGMPVEDAAEPRGTHGITVKMSPLGGIAAPGAPNTDVPTDRHVTARGTATITRRIGLRRSTTSD